MSRRIWFAVATQIKSPYLFTKRVKLRVVAVRPVFAR